MVTTFPTSVVEVRTPDGTMYVTILEDGEGNIIRISVQIGKSGTTIRAWTEAVSNLLTSLLSRKVPLAEIMNDLASHLTDRTSFNDDGLVRSGPDGIVYALYVYMKHRKVERTGKAYFSQRFRR